MTEIRTRALQRQAAATGDLQAKTRFLREQVRAGRLRIVQLQRLAHFGDPAAQLLLNNTAWPRIGLREWVQRLVRFGDEQEAFGGEAFVRLGIAAARRVLPRYRQSHPGHRWGSEGSRRALRGPRRAIEAAEAYVVCPCEDHAEAVSLASGFQQPPGRELLWQLYAISTCRRAAQVASSSVPRRFQPSSSRGDLVLEVSLLADNARGALRDRGIVSKRRADDLVREAVRVELEPWILGTGDPVRERVARRS